MNITERLQYIVNELFNGNKAAFAKKIGIAPTSISNYLSRERASKPSSDMLEKIINSVESVNPKWLLTGNESPFYETDNIPKISFTAGRPYYNVDFIGGFDLVLNDQTINPEYNIDFAPYNKDGVMWCNITGRSMEPEINSGDIIAIKEVFEWDKFLMMNEIYAIVTKNDLRTVKKIKNGSSNDSFMLVPSNPDFTPQEISKKMIDKVFSVLGCMKRL